MQKTFKLNSLGDKYKVVIKERTKLVTLHAINEQVNFYFGNPKYVEFEGTYLHNFLEARLCMSKADEIHSFILNQVK